MFRTLCLGRKPRKICISVEAHPLKLSLVGNMKHQNSSIGMEDESISSHPALELTRPLNCLFTGIAVIIGAVVSAASLDILWFTPILAFAAAALIAAGGNAINDYFDREIDRINRPERPIPSGRITAAMALRMAQVVFVLGVVLAFFINFYCFLLGALNSAVLALYAWRLKRRGLIGNLAIGYLVGSSFLFGGLSMSAQAVPRIPSELMVLVLMAALSTVGRELIKAVQDMQGDQKIGLRTFPLLHGAGKAAVLAIFFICIAVTLSPLPYLMGVFGWLYLATVVASIAAFVTAAAIIGMSQDTRSAMRSSLACKVGMGLGLLAFLVGVLVKLL